MLNTYTAGGDVNTGHEQVFTALYHEHHPAVEAYVRRRLTSGQDIDDVVAETFLTAWRRLDEVPHSAVLPWLYATARRILANTYRAEQRRQALAETIAWQRHSHQGDPADDVAGAQAVAVAFDSLSGTDREILRLALWEELPARHAARVIGCTTATFHVRLHRARRRLRQQLERVPSSPVKTVSSILGGADA
ncbi:RNA polymerase sigma factor [Streptomyces sp. NPDC008313]|uniref:RNA polymerase sigma factor n=1 Tax=Streptomyces sp. NPDC008313 TaxID=3364826 RepID=UPI0036E7C33D